MSEFTKLAHVTEIEPGSMKAIEVQYEKILLCNIEGEFFAVADECTHDSAPISDGRLDGDQIICPRHGARFCIRDGAVKAPPAVAALETYELKIDNEEIFIKLD